MSKTVLLTLGRLPKGLELARCLYKAGCRVYVADPFKTHLSKPSRAIAKSIQVTAPNTDQEQYLRDLLAIVTGYDVDIIIPVSEEALHVAQLTERLPETATLFCAPPDQLEGLHDKYSFIERARQAGLGVPETFFADTPEAQTLAAAKQYVVKPALGCSGTGLRLAQKGDALTQGEQTQHNIVQQRLDGQEISTLSLVRNGKVLGTTLYKGLIFAGTVATCFERLPQVPSIETWIETFMKSENYSGFIAFDFILEPDGEALPIECNPRLTSGLHFWAHDDLAAAVLGNASTTPIRYKSQSKLQEGHTSLTKAYAALPNVRLFLKRLKLVIRTRDVLWSWQDPLPFLLMTPMSWPILSQVLFQRSSFGEAATRDIEWMPTPRPNMPRNAEDPSLGKSFSPREPAA